MVDSTRLARFIKDAGLSFKQNSKSFIFTCPICNVKDKLYIRKSDGKFACWRCRETQGFQGAPEYALAELTGQPVPVVKKALYGHLAEHASVFLDVRFNELVDDEDLPEVEEESLDLPSLVWPYHCLPIDHPGAAKGLKYLEKRSIPLEIAVKYGIRYTPIKQAVVFPIYVNELLVGWQYRTVEELRVVLEDNSVATRLKAWSSDDIPRDRTLMFQNNLLNSDHAVLCEGPIDALRCELVGGGIASMGKAVSQAQVGVLCRSGIKRLYVALDPDAFREIDPLLSKFNDSLEIFKVNIPQKGDKPDLGALSFEEARDCILSSEPLKKNRLHAWIRPLPCNRKHDTLSVEN
jgi:hypothetical protein